MSISDRITNRRISSPSATGGKGTLFEQQVGASFLTLLLVRGIPPVLTDCVVLEVHLQTEHLNWNTDDICVIGINGVGVRRRLICQAKLKFTISSADQVCIDTIGDFWKDFKENPDFSRDLDRFAIITLHGTNTLLGDFSALLDCARVSRDTDGFIHRINTPGMVNKTVIRHYTEICGILNELEGLTVDIKTVWEFLKVLNVLSMDLMTSTCQTESQHKTLLALTATGTDAISTAESTWSDLVIEAGEGMTHGKSFFRDDLPNEILSRHSVVSDANHLGLRRLSEHSEVILNGIRSTIGSDFHLPRNAITQNLIEKLEENQIVLLTGPAGCGKSGVAKEVISQLSDRFIFCFRAEEFAAAHLDESLHKNQIPANAKMLSALMAGQRRKLLLVESVERLLESSTRDAFTDLLTLLKEDASWRLILTCRDYSCDLVRSSLLQLVNVSHCVLTISQLNDNELSAAEKAIPVLSRPLSNPRLKKLLRNPYILDKACRMDWPENRPLPEDEKAFRDKFLREIIRAEASPANDMPRRRQDALAEIALRRARALTQYVTRTDIDSDAVQALRSDSLLAHPPGNDFLVAPAHDVLEDWLILKWIDEQYETCDRSLEKLAADLGAYPAIRRTYRKWVAEIVEQDPSVADKLFKACIAVSSLPSHFRDDTLASLLKSSAASALIHRHKSLLFNDDRQVLKRIIHLLRVACVTTPSWVAQGEAVASLLHIPEGSSWKTVLQLLSENFTLFDAGEIPLLLGLTEDAARGISWQTPYPDEAEFVCKIAYWLLPYYDRYRDKEQRQRVLKIIAKLPNCNRHDYTKLLAGNQDEDEHYRQSEDFREIVLWSMEGMAACRDMPDEVILAVRNELIITEEMLRERRFYGGAGEVDEAFGIDYRLHHDCFPASAYCGPFFQLLRYNPDKAVDFLIDLFNYSGNWYGTGRIPAEYVESPGEIELVFADGTRKMQWCNQRLWFLYRGTSVGPYVLQSALMAFEQWLLNYAEVWPNEIDGLLCNIMRRSSNAAITAVIASVATAYPRLTPESLLALLSSPYCILLDRGRMASESQALALSGGLPFRTAEQSIADNERRQSNKLGHRRHDLEAAIINAQLGSHSERIQKLIDQHKANMPPADMRSEEDRIWLLSLHRMDLRQYNVVSEYQEPTSREQESTAVNETRMIRLDLGQPEPDVHQMMETSRNEYEAMYTRIGLLMWGVKVFERTEENNYDPTQWKSHILEAIRIRENVLQSPNDMHDPGRGGPEHVAAVCIRDHYDELTEEEKLWCIDTVCRAVEQSAGDWSDIARMQRYSMAGDRSSAHVLASLIATELPMGYSEQVRKAFACALLHPIKEVRGYAAAGVGKYLWQTNPAMAIRCINILAVETKMVQELWSVERKKSYGERDPLGAIMQWVSLELRRDFFGEFDNLVYEQLEIGDWIGSEAYSRILVIMSHAPAQPVAIQAFRKLAEQLVLWWREDDSRERRNKNPRERAMDVEVALPILLEEFLLKVSPAESMHILEPILNTVDKHPKEVASIIQGIISAEDRLQRTNQFWHLWTAFAERIKGAVWMKSVDREHSIGDPVLAAIFMTQYWRDDVRHWRSLEGYADCVERLFQSLPKSAKVLDNYIRYLYHIGEQSLPVAFRYIGNYLHQSDAKYLLSSSNAIFMLESLLRRFVYGKPLLLKSDSEIREAVLLLLDILVENGSSSAYRMRDDFVTPLQV